MALDYFSINKKAMQALLSVKTHTRLIEPKLKALVELRVSQINGCAYCVSLHSDEARACSETQKRLDCLPVWRESGLFSDREMAALDWTEAVTNISVQSDMEAQLQKTMSHFSEAEVVDLTIVISLMNSLNRVAISFSDRPG